MQSHWPASPLFSRISISAVWGLVNPISETKDTKPVLPLNVLYSTDAESQHLPVNDCVLERAVESTAEVHPTLSSSLTSNHHRGKVLHTFTMAAPPPVPPAGACHDAAHVTNAQARYNFRVANTVPNLGPNPACGGIGATRACEKVNSAHHGGANPFNVCPNHTQQGHGIVIRQRRPVAVPGGPAGPWPIRTWGGLLQGPNGAQDRGFLCDACINLEIVKFYARWRGVGQTAQPLNQAANTCKCER